jgi:hypothetical protein
MLPTLEGERIADANTLRGDVALEPASPIAAELWRFAEWRRKFNQA